MKELLENAGFIDVTENEDGTFDATKNRDRYKGMYICGYNPGLESNDVVEVEDVPLVLTEEVAPERNRKMNSYHIWVCPYCAESKENSGVDGKQKCALCNRKVIPVLVYEGHLQGLIKDAQPNSADPPFNTEQTQGSRPVKYKESKSYSKIIGRVQTDAT